MPEALFILESQELGKKANLVVEVSYLDMKRVHGNDF